MSRANSLVLKKFIVTPAVGVGALAALAPALLWTLDPTRARTLALGAISAARVVAIVAAYGLSRWYELLRGLCL
jgi:hypothetical protein